MNSPAGPGAIGMDKKENGLCESTGRFEEIPAASYSPTESPQQYHRLQGA